jgi:hypothetical protein
MSLTNWTEPLLQGLAYWIGYKKQLYPHSPLSEGAIIGESTNLIYSHLENGQKLHCEYSYSKILDFDTEDRADLVITENDELSVVIEVKRLEAGRTRIIRDFEKLFGIRYPDKKVRCFVLLVCQQKLPKEFVNNKGVAKTGVLTFESLSGNIDVKVLRTCKSTFSFKENAISKANYVCLIEVL